MLDQPQDALHFVDRGFLAPDVVHADPEVGVVGVDHRLADARVQIEGAEEEHEVRAEQEQQVDEIREQRLQQLWQYCQRFLGNEIEEPVHHPEVDRRHCADEESPLPEHSAVGFYSPLQNVCLWGDSFTHDQGAPGDAQDAARQQHGEDGVRDRPADAELHIDVGEGEGGTADEQREDPEDDHGG